MPEKKKQHTVPKFYLKFFSNKKDNKTIGIFNIKSERFIRNGSLESQACKDYFYGKDKKIEDALQVIESEASRIFTSLIRDFRLPDKGTSDYFTLIVHTVYQASRTEYTSDAILISLLKQLIKKISVLRIIYLWSNFVLKIRRRFH